MRGGAIRLACWGAASAALTDRTGVEDGRRSPHADSLRVTAMARTKKGSWHYRSYAVSYDAHDRSAGPRPLWLESRHFIQSLMSLSRQA